MDSKPKRKGRPLLVAAVGIAFVSYADCTPYGHVGNLRGPDPRPDATEPDGGATDTPPIDGEAPLAVAAGAADAATPDAATTDAGIKNDAGATRDASAPATRDAGPMAPVGNLRPPPPPFPVGNLRAPADKK